MCIMCIPGAHADEKVVSDLPGAGVTDGGESQCGCWELSVGPLHDLNCTFHH